MILSKLPEKQNPKKQALVKQVKLHLFLDRQLEAESGWGYAQIHGYIGVSMLERLRH